MKKLLVAMLLALVLVPNALMGHALTRPLNWNEALGNKMPEAPISMVLAAPHGAAAVLLPPGAPAIKFVVKG